MFIHFSRRSGSQARIWYRLALMSLPFVLEQAVPRPHYLRALEPRAWQGSLPAALCPVHGSGDLPCMVCCHSASVGSLFKDVTLGERSALPSCCTLSSPTGLLWFPENGPLAKKAYEAGKMDLGAGWVHRAMTTTLQQYVGLPVGAQRSYPVVCQPHCGCPWPCTQRV